MNHNDLIVSYPGFFVSEFREESLWLKFSGNFFHNFQSFDRTDFLHTYFETLSKARDIKTVVIYSAFSESGSDEYLRFFLFECPEQELGHFGFSNTMNRYELHRFCNMIDQTVLDIAAMNKMFIHICTGDVLSLFMNIGLSCDHRIVSTDTVFHNIYQEIGMLPKGGAPFILGRDLGTGRAKELLLKPQIPAREAYENHIVDDVVPPDQLEDRAMAMARRFNALPDQTLFGVKRLVNYSLRELSEYLAFETDQVVKIGQRKDFGNG
jgi:enoyl-CoA hydratase/carnithine racemase